MGKECCRRQYDYLGKTFEAGVLLTGANIVPAHCEGGMFFFQEAPEDYEVNSQRLRKTRRTVTPAPRLPPPT